MYYVREKNRVSNLHARERGVRYNTKDSEIDRERHIGNRREYNDKRLGANYTGGNRNSAVSFMFFNFPNDWGMGKLWMLFKKFGTVFDMYMAQKRLRNGERYGFVRFKQIMDVEVLLKRLREIKFGEVPLKIFIAFDRRSSNNRWSEANRNSTYGSESVWRRNDTKGGIRDGRNFAEVVNGERKNSDKMEWNRVGRSDECKKQERKNEMEDEKEYEDTRIIEVDDEEVNTAFFNKCVIGEVKSLCYLTKLVRFCEDLGLNNVEVKFLGGLEVMMVFDTSETASNILKCIDHGLRRWVHKLRCWSRLYTLPGRLTWISIIGVPVSCWSESVFKKIAAFHGRVIASNNCNLEGNQNLSVGRVQLHTTNKGFIKETLYVKIYGRKFKVDVIEEVGDIMEIDMEDDSSECKNTSGSMDGKKNGEDNDMMISDGENNEDDSEEGTDSEDDDCNNEEDGGHELRLKDDGGRKREEDEESRVSHGSRVGETFKEEVMMEEKKTAHAEDVIGEGNLDNQGIKLMDGDKEKASGGPECESNLDNQGINDSHDKNYENKDRFGSAALRRGILYLQVYGFCVIFVKRLLAA